MTMLIFYRFKNRVKIVLRTYKLNVSYFIYNYVLFIYCIKVLNYCTIKRINSSQKHRSNKYVCMSIKTKAINT